MLKKERYRKVGQIGLFVRKVGQIGVFVRKVGQIGLLEK